MAPCEAAGSSGEGASEAHGVPPPIIDLIDEDGDVIIPRAHGLPRREAAQAATASVAAAAAPLAPSATSGARAAEGVEEPTTTGLFSQRMVGGLLPGTDGMARGSLAHGSLAYGSLSGSRANMARPRAVFAASVAARIRAIYKEMPEASKSVPCASVDLATQPSVFHSTLLKDAHKVSVGTAGGGLTRRDQAFLATLLLGFETEAIRNTLAAVRAAGARDSAGGSSAAAATGGAGGAGAAGSENVGDVGAGCIAAAFPAPNAMVSALRHEQECVLALRKWMQVPITLGNTTYTLYYRDLLGVGIDAVKAAKKLNLTGGAPPNTHSGERQCIGSLNSYLFLELDRSVRSLHGAHARVLLAKLCADEALASAALTTSTRSGMSSPLCATAAGDG